MENLTKDSFIFKIFNPKARKSSLTKEKLGFTFGSRVFNGSLNGMTHRTTSAHLQYRWIGLQNTINTCDCNSGQTLLECQQCRSLFSWTDGAATATGADATTTTYSNWHDFEPSVDEACSLQNDDGVWQGSRCLNNDALKFICKKGKRTGK